MCFSHGTRAWFSSPPENKVLWENTSNLKYPVAYSSKRAVYRVEDRFVYKINKAEITSLTIKDGVCKIKGNGKVQMPEWAEEDALVKKKNKDFSFVMAFEQRDATRRTLSWKTL